MFCSSPSVIPTHTPGTDGPSRATHLCVSLVAHSASYFSVDAIRLRNGETLTTPAVVLAMGPWSRFAAAWLDLRIPIYPVRGQLLELRVPGPQLRATISYGGMYLVHKADGLTLA